MQNDLTSPTVIKELLRAQGQNAKKFLGQNFLIDKNILDIIVSCANIDKADHVVEVGPGLGVLTQRLADASKKVTSIEVDSSLLPILEKTLSGKDNVEILNEDALKFSPPKSAYKVVANIPYNITSPLINHFLQRENPPKDMTLLVQYEVAEKVCKKEPDMSILSLQVALFGTSKMMKKVSPSCFYPPPKVNSAILKITPFLPSDPDFVKMEDALKILKIAKMAFSQKRKKLSNTLGKMPVKCDMFADKRPQHLSVEDWKILAKNF